jgi:hypothetical protein
MSQKEIRLPTDERLSSSVRESLMKYAGERDGGAFDWTGLKTVDDIFTEAARATDRLRRTHNVDAGREIRDGYGYINFRRGSYKGKTIGEYQFTSRLDFCNDEYPGHRSNWTPQGLKVLWHVENSYLAGKGFPKSAAPDAAAPGNSGRGTHLRLVKEQTIKKPRTTFPTFRAKGSRDDN